MPYLHSSRYDWKNRDQNLITPFILASVALDPGPRLYRQVTRWVPVAQCDLGLFWGFLSLCAVLGPEQTASWLSAHPWSNTEARSRCWTVLGPLPTIRWLSALALASPGYTDIQFKAPWKLAIKMLCIICRTFLWMVCRFMEPYIGSMCSAVDIDAATLRKYGWCTISRLV